MAFLAALPSAGFGQEAAEVPMELQDPVSTVTLRADSQEKVKDVFHLRGNVEVTFRQMKLTADEMSYDNSTGEVVARGNVTFSDEESFLEADEARYNLRTRTGSFENGRGHVRSARRSGARGLTTEHPFFVRAQRLERTTSGEFVVQKARLTSCECEKTGWALGARRARVEPGDRVVVRDAWFRLFRLPLLYLPAGAASIAERPRQTGFLLPHVGNSSQKGFIVGAGFFWAFNPSADLTVGIENYSIRGVARTGRFRMRPSQTSSLDVDYFGVNDRGTGPNRQTRAPGQGIRAAGQARDLGGGFRGVVDVDYITSLAFRLTFTDNFTQAVVSEARQTGFVSKNFDAYSLNVYFSRYQNFLSAERIPGNYVIIRKAPSVSFAGLDKQVGESPFYFSFDADMTGLGRTEPGFRTPRFSERFDVWPRISVRSRPLAGFQFTPSVALRATRYGTGLAEDRSPLNRLLGEIAFSLRPPSLERTFKGTRWGQRFKHVVEPEVRYRLVRGRRAGEWRDLIRYDETDILAETHEVEYSLTNTLFFRRDVAEGEERPQARELVSWRLSQKYYIDPTFGGALDPGRRVVFEPTISLTGFSFARGRHLSPVVSVLKFSPFENYDTELRADIDPRGGVLNAGITSHVRMGIIGLSVTDFFVNKSAVLPTPLTPTGEPRDMQSFHLLRAIGTYGDLNRRGFSGAFGMDFNFAQRIAHQVLSQVSYNFGCFSLDFEFRRFALGDLRRENQFRVAISLANIGSFGNLKPRERLY